MRDYVVRRAWEHKQYKTVARESGIGEEAWEWLRKLASGVIPNPGSDRIEKLWRYFKMNETRKRRAA